MILQQIFKTLHNARKRCAFENAHRRGDRKYHYNLVRFHAEGQRAPDFAPSLKGDYWRIEKVSQS